MARILFATVPLSGHVNPGIPIARRLVQLGHDVVWYCGIYYRGKIQSTGARFEPFRRAPEFHDGVVTSKFGRIPTRTLIAHSGFYIRRVFYDPMPAYYEDLQEVLKKFDADVIVSDEWFTGGIPFSEKKIKPWILYGNSPLMLITKDAPTPGAGLMPAKGHYGRNRDRIVNFIAGMLFIPIHAHINKVRAKAGLPRLQYFFAEQNIRYSALTLKFNTAIFEFPTKELPEQIRFVGPVLPEQDHIQSFPWLSRLSQAGIPNIFITQGSVDIYNIHKLIIPAVRALRKEKVHIIISTGGQDCGALKEMFPEENILIEPYIPYALIMPFVSVMITNGGYGGISTALSYGVPLIIAGNSEDKPEIATRVRYSGAGIDLKTGRPSSRAIEKAVRKIFANPTYKENAQRVMKDFSGHDAVEESVEHILKTVTSAE